MNKLIYILLIFFHNSSAFDLIPNAVKRTYYMNFPDKIFEAVRNGNIPYVQKILQSNLDINYLFTNESGSKTLLSDATYFNQSEMTQFLVDNGADVNQFSTLHFQTPLANAIMSALHNDDVTIPIILLRAGAKTELLDDEKADYIPLLLAIHLKKSKCVELLLSFGAKIDMQCPRNHIFNNYFYRNADRSVSALAERVHAGTEKVTAEKKRNIKSLEIYNKLLNHAVNPSEQFFIDSIKNGRFGLVKLALSSGMYPKQSDLQLAKKEYTTLMALVGNHKSKDSNYNRFTLGDQEIYAQAYREIGKKLIEYLRWIPNNDVKITCSCKTYPAVYKYGLKSVCPEMPLELMRYIAWLSIS